MVTAIVVAGGKGKRMGKDINKQYLLINGREIVARTLEVFQRSGRVDEIILVSPEAEIDFCRENIVKKYALNKVRKIIAGGPERQDSVYNGLLACSSDTDIVMIHDGARPFITEDMLERSIDCARKYGACSLGVPVKDTIKVVDGEGFAVDTPRRSGLYAVQTPQTFKYRTILEAHEAARKVNIEATDDTMLVEALGKRVKFIEGSYTNIKITTPEDMVFAEAILS